MLTNTRPNAIADNTKILSNTSPSNLLSITDALAQLKQLAQEHAQQITLQTEVVDINHALGKICAQQVYAPLDIPPSNNSAMDGFAVSTNDLVGDHPYILEISQTIGAGAYPQPLLKNTAVRIFTGATIPAHANAVVMQEECEFNTHTVHILKPVKPNQNIRLQGEDVAAGQLVLSQGKRITAMDIAQLASLGIAQLCVYTPLRVGILSTGDELTQPGQTLARGKIYNSNQFLIQSILHSWGFTVVNLGHLPDSLQQTTQYFNQLVHHQNDITVDVIISSGGVSVGDGDYLKAALAQCGHINLWKVAIKPGKPLAVGSIGHIPWIGLPGNPQAVLVSLLVMLRSFIFILQQRIDVDIKPVYLPANFSSTKVQSRGEFLRVIVDNISIKNAPQNSTPQSMLSKHPNQSSGSISSAGWADGLALVPAQQVVETGLPLAFYSFNQLLW